jgi:hypothetical protein
MKNESLKYLRIFLSLIFIFFTYAVLVCLLPTENIKKNIKKGASDMACEGDYPFAIINKKQYQMDNFTDALVLNINYSIDNKRPVNAAMSAKWQCFSDANLTQGLQKLADGEEPTSSIGYYRYWHGNSFLIRPFFLFADYATIRWLMYAVSSILLLLLGIKLYQNLGTIKTVAFVFGLLSVNIFVTQFSIQFFPVITLAIIACILMCNFYRDRKKILLLSFIFGCLTVYFDLFTTQLLTCGLPLIVYLSLSEEDSLKKRFITLFFFGFLWATGYLLTWGAKWTLGTIFTEVNVFYDAFNQSVNWYEIQEFTRFGAIEKNFNLLPVVTINLVLLLLLPLVIFYFNKKAVKTNLLLLITVALPYLWYFVVAKPCLWHWWFSYRAQAISVIAVFFIFINFISWDKVSQTFERCKKFYRK